MRQAIAFYKTAPKGAVMLLTCEIKGQRMTGFELKSFITFVGMARKSHHQNNEKVHCQSRRHPYYLIKFVWQLAKREESK